MMIVSVRKRTVYPENLIKERKGVLFLWLKNGDTTCGTG